MTFMRITSVSLPDSLTERLDSVARQSDRSRSYVVRKLLEQSLTGADRLHALEQIAAQGLEENAAARTREKEPNATALISEASVEGHAAVRAHQTIAAGNRKAAR
jgi:predicted transcriptional regulator